MVFSAARQMPWWSRGSRNAVPPNGRSSHSIKQSADSIQSATSLHNNPGVWTWLSNRRASASPDHPMGAPTSSPAENHYTHMDDSYSPVGVGDEALYAELDRESIRSANPSYQNTAYSQCDEVDQEVPIVSSAPSSAYYSDLSTTGTGTTTTTNGNSAYEVVGLTHLSQPMPNWELSDQGSNGRRPPRLAAINETTTSLPSDYV